MNRYSLLIALALSFAGCEDDEPDIFGDKTCRESVSSVSCESACDTLNGEQCYSAQEHALCYEQCNGDLSETSCRSFGSCVESAVFASCSENLDCWDVFRP